MKGSKSYACATMTAVGDNCSIECVRALKAHFHSRSVNGTKVTNVPSCTNAESHYREYTSE